MADRLIACIPAFLSKRTSGGLGLCSLTTVAAKRREKPLVSPPTLSRKPAVGLSHSMFLALCVESVIILVYDSCCWLIVSQPVFWPLNKRTTGGLGREPVWPSGKALGR